MKKNLILVKKIQEILKKNNINIKINEPQNLLNTLNNYLQNNPTIFKKESHRICFYQEMNIQIDTYNKNAREEEILEELKNIEEDNLKRERLFQFINANISSGEHFNENDQLIELNSYLNDISLTTELAFEKIYSLYIKCQLPIWPLLRVIYLGFKDKEGYHSWFQENDTSKNNNFKTALIAVKKAHEEGDAATLRQARLMQVGGCFIGFEMVLAIIGTATTVAGLVLSGPFGWGALAIAIVSVGVIIGCGLVMGNFIRYAHQDALREYNLETAFDKYNPQPTKETEINPHSRFSKTTLYSKGGALVEGGLSFAGSMGIGLLAANAITMGITMAVTGTAVTLLALSPVGWGLLVGVVALTSLFIAYSMYKGVLALDGREVKEHYQLEESKQKRQTSFLPLWQGKSKTAEGQHRKMTRRNSCPDFSTSALSASH